MGKLQRYSMMLMVMFFMQKHENYYYNNYQNKIESNIIQKHRKTTIMIEIYVKICGEKLKTIASPLPWNCIISMTKLSRAISHWGTPSHSLESRLPLSIKHLGRMRESLNCWQYLPYLHIIGYLIKAKPFLKAQLWNHALV